MTRNNKRVLENLIEAEIQANPNGINTRTLMSIVYNKLQGSIPNLNMHHVAGMLSWVYKSKEHVFLIRSNGYSIIA